jgi:GT2 family glycosyltransferase
MLLLDRPGTIDSAGDALTRGLLPYMRGHGEADGGQYDDERQVFAASGGAALWRMSALTEIGLFDERFFAYYEDVDLGFRARLAGYECWYAPRAVVFHERGGSAEADSAFALFHHVRNRWFLILKDLPTPMLLRRLPRLVAADATWWFRARRSGNLRPLLHAYRGVVGNVAQVLAERRRIQARRRLQLRELERLLQDAGSQA